MRSNCVPHGKKENPTEATAGLSKSDQNSLGMTGEEFSKAFRTLIQARDYIDWACEAWREIDSLNRLDRLQLLRDSKIDQQHLAQAEIIRREFYRVEFCTEFKRLFGIPYERFDLACVELRHAIGGEI